MGDRSVKDKQMAAYLKKIGHRRTSQCCPICYKTVQNKQFDKHIAVHK